MLYEAKDVYLREDAEKAISNNPDMKWYVARVASGCDAAFIRSLREHLELRDLTSEVGMILSPTERVISSAGRESLKPIYSGYVFVLANMTPELVHCVKSSSKSMGFISQTGFNDENLPPRMNKGEVDDFISKLPVVDKVSEQGTVVVNGREVVVGSKVVLNVGFEGIVKSVNSESGELIVGVGVLGSESDLTVKAGDVVYVGED